MQYEEFIAGVRDAGALADRDHVEQAATATLQVLGQRLAGGEPSDLAAQLPIELKSLLDQHGGAGESFDVDDFLRRVAAQEGRGCSPEQARDHARAVLATVAAAVSAGEVANLRAQLPAGYGPLFESPQGRR